jgi:hypothetical protein
MPYLILLHWLPAAVVLGVAVTLCGMLFRCRSSPLYPLNSKQCQHHWQQRTILTRRCGDAENSQSIKT